MSEKDCNCHHATVMESYQFSENSADRGCFSLVPFSKTFPTGASFEWLVVQPAIFCILFFLKISFFPRLPAQTNIYIDWS
jgi:hypothetical protein